MPRAFGQLEISNLREVFKSKQLGWRQGGFVTRLDEAFAAFTGSRFGICRNSAMTALAQAVSVSGAGCGDEVICDPLVHFGGVAALSFNCVPRFVDVKYDTYLMDPDAVRKAVTRHTKALIVTNLWGLCAELDALRAICRKHKIFMIEDCAHVIGARWRGKHAGTFGDLGCFSFQQGKHICTGDGGVMVTDREDLHHALYNEWAFKGESPSFLTLNFRMNELTAAVGLAQLERFPEYLKEYNAALEMYNEAISDCLWLRNRTVPKQAEQAGYNWACLWEGDGHGMKYDRFKAIAAEEGAPFRYEFTERPATEFPIFRKSTAYHKTDCPVRCPFYKGSYSAAKTKLPVAADILKRVMTVGLIEKKPSQVKAECRAIRRVIARMEGE
ncbi:MAG: DegT/DnrJ/EryC1/StrS family aminotransferase [Candidatus Latescibacteria bacterium]|jgi:dTDP-4-amino-4,6-dideoxygalactose transaminase|nr:DegT/DnrJ/EryC1/StrS family aminotransferase [Candidatus Latescibacterota bacterium]